jgi:hypothetical protein
MLVDSLPASKSTILPAKTSAWHGPRTPLFRASQVTHVSAYASHAAWPGDRLRLPLDPQPKEQRHGYRA